MAEKTAQNIGSPLRKELNNCPRRPTEISSEHGSVVEKKSRHATPDGRNKNQLGTRHGAIIEENK